MEEDATATNMDEEYKDDEDEDEEVRGGGGARRMVEAHKGCQLCLGGVPTIYSKAQQEQLISCSMHILQSSHGWKSGPSLEAHHRHMQEGGFQIKSKGSGDGLERRYNSTNGNYPCRGS